MKVRVNGRIAVKDESVNFDADGFTMVEARRPFILIDNHTGEVLGTYSNKASAIRTLRKIRARNVNA